METANKAQQMITNNIGKGLQNTTKIAGNTSHKLKQLFGDFDLGVFGNVFSIYGNHLYSLQNGLGIFEWI